MTTTVVSPIGAGAHRTNAPRMTMGRMRHIDGLRGLAISLVVIFHVFVGKVSSGVDVFLLMGGVLFVTSQMRNALNPRGMSWGQALIRIVRRLMPALTVVVTVTTVAMLLIYPSGSWKPLLIDASSAIGYWVNWRMVYLGDSYAAAGSEVSVYQHLWSMSVQLQIYATILTIVYATVRVMEKKGAGKRKISIAISSIVGALSIASFAYATYLIFAGRQSENYFSTFSRFWEIGVGALLGMVLTELVFAAWIRVTFSIVGLALIICTGLFLDGAEQFPGPVTLVPIIGAVMVIVSGLIGSVEKRNFASIGLTSLLETPVFSFLGKIAYSLYLWHWPILIMTVKITGIEAKNPVVGIPVIVSSILLAYLTWRFIEMPLQQSRKPERANPFTFEYVSDNLALNYNPALPVAASVLALVVGVVGLSPFIYDGGRYIQSQRNAAIIESSGGFDANYPGAMSVISGEKAPTNMPIQPDPLDIKPMMPITQQDKCFTNFGNGELVLTAEDGSPCAYGDTNSNRTMYVVGGSHSEQYLGALDTIGKNRGIKIIPIIKMGCPLYQDFRWDGQDYPECYADWSPKAEKYILDNPPTDGVFMISSRMSSVDGTGPEIVPQVYVDVFNRIANAGIKIYAVRDNPWIMKAPGVQKDVRSCVSEKGNSPECGMNTNGVMLSVNPAEIEFGANPNIKVVDFTDMMIADGFASPVIGNILVYRDSHHLTSQFVQSMTPEIDKRLFGQ